MRGKGDKQGYQNKFLFQFLNVHRKVGRNRKIKMYDFPLTGVIF